MSHAVFYVFVHFTKHIKMKLILLFIGLCPTLLLAQQKGDNTIVVDTTIQASVLKSLLFTNGLMQENSDTLLITTSGKMIKGGDYLKLNILKTDTGIYIKGLLRVPTMAILFGAAAGNEYDPFGYHKKNGSHVSNAWEEMNRIALLIGNKVKYLKQ